MGADVGGGTDVGGETNVGGGADVGGVCWEGGGVVLPTGWVVRTSTVSPYNNMLIHINALFKKFMKEYHINALFKKFIKEYLA